MIKLPNLMTEHVLNILFLTYLSCQSALPVINDDPSLLYLALSLLLLEYTYRSIYFDDSISIVSSTYQPLANQVQEKSFTIAK